MRVVLVNPLHWYFSPNHLAHVIEQMRRLGPPVIRAYFDGQMWHAREGTHRLRACLVLGCEPKLVPVKWPKSQAALERAKLGAARRAHIFRNVEVVSKGDV